MIPQIGLEGQKKIKKAKIFLAGLGGLGSVSAYYLVAAGVGFLRVVDRDKVELGNLNRQILHLTGDIGRTKSKSAAEKLNKLNPECNIEALQEKIGDDNIEDMVGDCSIIVDGTDNLETRRILNKFSQKKGIPFIFGGVDGLNGMASTFMPGETACFECLFSHFQVEDKTPAVLGALPGIIGSIQALEVLKLLLGMENGLLKSRLLYIKGSLMNFKIVEMERNPDCLVCKSG
jgi:adenylyltransferase/sulfurtransferase